MSPTRPTSLASSSGCALREPSAACSPRERPTGPVDPSRLIARRSSVTPGSQMGCMGFVAP
eukprot:8726691-Pyramimonas_sp.AAC.1